MRRIAHRLAVALAVCLPLTGAPALAQQEAVERELEKYRRMMKDDPWSNPANLDADRGETLWKTAAGPKTASLEQCDLGLGAGKVEGAFAQLPRYFADADRVMDVETRILWCRQALQGIDDAKFLDNPHPAGGQPVKDVGAIATWIASKSSGLKFAAKMEHPKEKEAIALGENLFNRRMGPFDFACTTCHADSGKRIRLQPLPFLAKPEEARKVIGEWPAYRVSSTHVMTMQHRVLDCFWQMRMHRVEMGSETTNALIAYMVKTAEGGDIAAPGMKR
ncbi:MAG: sulfur oxidation c-type cytochrome SoxA [Hyphomicrobiaceae bacterium]